MKQSKLRRRRVIRFAIVYFVLLVVFIALVAGPVYAGKAGLVDSFKSQLSPGGFKLFQDPKVGHNDTSPSPFMTGTHAGGAAGTDSSAGSTAGAKIKLF